VPAEVLRRELLLAAGAAEEIDARRVGLVGQEGLVLQLAESQAEVCELLRVQLLVTEDDDGVVEEGLVDLRELRVGEIGEIDAEDLAAERAGEGAQFE
jgi:hypothetical protein